VGLPANKNSSILQVEIIGGLAHLHHLLAGPKMLSRAPFIKIGGQVAGFRLEDGKL
jgi:hypothetical protein